MEWKTKAQTRGMKGGQNIKEVFGVGKEMREKKRGLNDRSSKEKG